MGARALGIDLNPKFEKALPAQMQEDQTSIGYNSIGSHLNRGKLNIRQSVNHEGPSTMTLHDELNGGMQGRLMSVASISVINQGGNIGQEMGETSGFQMRGSNLEHEVLSARDEYLHGDHVAEHN